MPQPSIHERFDALASADLAKFREFFRRMHKLFPQEAAESCLWYIGAHGLDKAAQAMAYWISADATYITVLLDAESLPVEVASKAIAVVRNVDSQFYIRFLKSAAALESPAAIVHGLALLPAMGDYSILIPWLRTLSQSLDERVRARSTKLLCELRPNKTLIERQLQSDNPRIRSGALEALWQAPIPESAALLRSSLTDSHHRVVGNALVGLYKVGESDALDKMVELSKHKDQLFRAAMAWAMGVAKDARAIPALQELTRDRSYMVRKRALTSLLETEQACCENG